MFLANNPTVFDEGLNKDLHVNVVENGTTALNAFDTRYEFYFLRDMRRDGTDNS
jgi:hypothetical protein